MEPFDPDAAAPSGSGIFGLPFTPVESRVVVVPIPFEATTSYGGGASRGPSAILAASRQVDLFDHETGRPYERGIAMLPIPREIVRLNREAKRLAGPIVRRGGDIGRDKRLGKALRAVNAIGERVNTWTRKTTGSLLQRGKMPVPVGGDHSTPFGAIQAYAEAFPGLGVLHVDAHADLREAYEGFTWSHASIMHNVATRLPGVSRIVQAGIRDIAEEEQRMIRDSKERILAFFDADVATRLLRGEPFVRIADEVAAALPGSVYVSFDIDGLDPTLCPHTGTPVPGGLSFHQAMALLDAVVRAGKIIVGCDLMEVAPGPRGDDWDGNVGARLLYKMIGYALLSQSRSIR